MHHHQSREQSEFFKKRLESLFVVRTLLTIEERSTIVDPSTGGGFWFCFGQWRMARERDEATPSQSRLVAPVGNDTETSVFDPEGEWGVVT
jgi:hypothetical protein